MKSSFWYTRLLTNLAIKASLLIRMGTNSLRSVHSINGIHLDSLPFNSYPGMYEDAVSALNGLQSNAAAIEKSRIERSANAHKSVTNTISFLKRMGIQISDLDKLNIIHVAGTKGKGSTCAFAESILRQSGLKTGLYSSPHLVAVRERIRINGQPLSKEKFTMYFWEVFRKLEDTRNLHDPEDPGMPQYFMFLTVMAFHVFLQERVDVAVLEVGIGGEYDCTNVIRSPIAVGVTSLGLDHVGLLGKTIDKIAWQKAGIFKNGVPAFTVLQTELALSVLKERANQIGCPLYLTPEFEAYKWQRKPVMLGVAGEAQKQNASLAMQLCRAWLLAREAKISGMPLSYPLEQCVVADVFEVPPRFKAGLSQCFWPGRCQILRKGSITYFLDGAHTAESMEHCVKWFKEALGKQDRNTNERLVLLFNCTGDRKPDALLQHLVGVPFDFVIFCPNKVSSVKDMASDQSNFTVDTENEIKQCQNNRNAWCALRKKDNNHNYSESLKRTPSIFGNEIEDSYAVFACLRHAIQWITQNQNPQFKKDLLPSYFCPLPDALRTASSMKILVTGSLHLVGGVLSLIDPELNNLAAIPSTESSGS